MSLPPAFPAGISVTPFSPLSLSRPSSPGGFYPPPDLEMRRMQPWVGYIP
jgi:hypothetical protein